MLRPEDVAATRVLGSGEIEASPEGNWWSGWGDAQLARLVEEGLAGSPDLRVVEGRLNVAQGLAGQAGAALLPRLDAEAGAFKVKQSYNNGFPAEFVPQGWNNSGRAAAGLGFDFDLWGRNRAALAAATSDVRASGFDLAQARLLLSTGIAAAYADLARLAAERAVLEQALEVRSQTRALVAERVENGLDNLGTLKLADAALPAARADLAAIDEAIGLTRNRLAALVGKGPDRGLDIALPAVPRLDRALPSSVGAELIGRRPDVAAARARVEAAAARVRVARADFYPALRLDALIGLQSLGLSDLVRDGSTFGQVGPALSLPIFRGGALSGRYRGARGAYDEALAGYDRAVLDAYRDLADVVTSRHALTMRLAESRAALGDAEQAWSIARQRYEGGLSSYLDVLSAEERVLQGRSIVAGLEARGFALEIALIRALGGGFSSKDQNDG